VQIVVTGGAGFIGSHLTEALLARGDAVRVVDCFTDYYDPAAKEANLAGVGDHPRFELVRADLRTADLDAALDGAEVVFHEAAQPGVRLSWADGFAAYDGHNILATQRLLEAARRVTTLQRLVYASSSSVYGNAARYPTTEEDRPAPHSPYGVTKLAAEHLCAAYAANFALPTVMLRYFTVYGPRQRPDMAFHRLLLAGLGGAPFPLYGDGSAVRDFTFVGDVVAANLAAAGADVAPGTVCNIAGGGQAVLRDIIDLAGDLLGAPVPLERFAGQAGDVARTGGTIDRAGELLGWEPAVGLREGLAAEAVWLRERLESA
jgi:nucleoside-diphosphate-sugar epimerase